MPFWTGSTALNVANMSRLGPMVQGIVGTDGAYADLYDAMGDPAGPQWRRVIVVPGATLNTDLTISGANYGCIMGYGMQFITGTGKLTLDNCAGWVLQYFRLTGTVTATGAINIIGGGDRNIIDHCWVYTSGGSGIYLARPFNRVINCTITNSAVDGIKIDAGLSYSWVRGCGIGGCTGWGINDASNKVIASDNYVLTNTAGQINTTSTYLSNNVVT